MTTRAEIVAAARRWIGTPHRHQQAMNGLGADCIGLVRGVGIEEGCFPADFLTLPEVQPFKGYERSPGKARLEEACGRFMTQIPVSQAKAADVVMMQYDGENMHLGFLADYQHGGFSIIHSSNAVKRVVEHRLSPSWKARITRAYQLPGVTD